MDSCPLLVTSGEAWYLPYSIPRRHALLCRERPLRGHTSTSPACPARAAPRPLLRCPPEPRVVTAHAHRLGLAQRLRRRCLELGNTPHMLLSSTNGSTLREAGYRSTCVHLPGAVAS